MIDNMVQSRSDPVAKCAAMWKICLKIVKLRDKSSDLSLNYSAVRFLSHRSFFNKIPATTILMKSTHLQIIYMATGPSCVYLIVNKIPTKISKIVVIPSTNISDFVSPPALETTYCAFTYTIIGIKSAIPDTIVCFSLPKPAEDLRVQEFCQVIPLLRC